MNVWIIAAVISAVGAATVPLPSTQGLQVGYTIDITAGHVIPGNELPNLLESGLLLQVEIDVVFAEISKLTVTTTNITNDFFTQIKNHSIYFSYKNGVVGEIFADPAVPEHIVNFQRGLVSGLQVPLTGQQGRVFAWERDILGDCESTIVRSDNVVLKSKETHLCAGKPAFTTLIPVQDQESKVVFGALNGEYRLANTSGGRVYVYNASLTQQESFAPLTKTAGSAQSVMQMYIWETKSPQVVPKPLLRPNYRNGSLMLAYYSSQPMIWRSCDTAASLLEELSSCHPSDVPRLFLELVQTLRTCSQSKLKEFHMKYGIKKGSSPYEVAPERKRKYFLDALAYIGTEAALSLIADSIQNSEYQLSTARQHELINSIAFIPHYYTSPCVLLSKTLEMAKKTPTWQTSSLILGSVTSAVFNNKNAECSMEMTKAVEWLIEKLNTNLAKVPATYSFKTEPAKADKRSWENAVHAIKSLGNAGIPWSISALVAAIKQPKLLTVGRSAAVHALKAIAKRSPTQVREVCRSIIMNVEENDEVRIAAFSVYVTSIGGRVFLPPPVPLTVMILNQVANESKMSVKSHMCRMLTQLRTTTDPYHINRKSYLSIVMRMSRAYVSCAATHFPCFASTYIRRYMSFADFKLPRRLPRDLLGGAVRLSYYTQDGRTLPNNVFAKIEGHAFGYHANLFEIGVRGTGVNRLLQHLFGPAGYFRLLARNFTTSNLNRPEGFSMDLQSLDDNITVSGFVKLLDSELSWNHNEQPNMMRLLYDHPNLRPLRDELSEVVMEKFTFSQLPRLVKAWKEGTLQDTEEACGNEMSCVLEKLKKSIPGMKDIKNFWNYLMTGTFNLDHGQLNVAKTGSFMDIKRTVPTILGFPLNMTANGIGYFGMDAEGSIDYYAEGWDFLGQKHDGFQIKGSMKPRLAVMSQVNITLDATFAQPKLVFSGNMTMNFTQDGRIRLYDNYTVNMQLYEMPENENLLINSTYDVFVQKGAFKQSIGLEKRKKTTVFEPFGDNILGIMVVSNISFPYYKGMGGKELDGTPWFPLSGPANMTLAFQRVAPVTMLNFTFFNITDLISSKGIYNGTIEAVGTPLRISSNVSWDWNKMKQRAIVVNVSSGSIDDESGHYFFLTQISTTDFSDSKLTREAWIDSTLKTDTHYNNVSVYVKGSKFNGTIWRTKHTHKEVKSLIKTLTEFKLDVNGTVKGWEMLNASMYLHNKKGQLTHELHANASMNLTHFNLTVNSTLFKTINISYCYASEARRAFCHSFGDHVITFDGLRYKAAFAPQAEYVLSRHRHPNDTFAITKKGEDVIIYLNGTVYTLTPDHTQLKIDNEFVPLPYKVHRTINVRKVVYHSQTYVRLSAFAGVDIVYSPNDVMLSISRYFRNQTGGLCGNSNANGTEEDEFELPTYEIAGSVNEFIPKWIVPETINPGVVFESSFVVECEPTEDQIKICQEVFYKAMKKAHVFVDVHPYYDACLCDEASGKGHISSLRAYAKAAHIRGVSSLDGCVYDSYGPFGQCENGHHSQERKVLLNPLGNACSQSTNVEPCPNSSVSQCPAEKLHLIQVKGQKVCRSRHRHSSCGSCCEPKHGEQDIAEFYCIGISEPIENFGNASPLFLPIETVESCEPVQDYKQCLVDQANK